MLEYVNTRGDSRTNGFRSVQVGMDFDLMLMSFFNDRAVIVLSQSDPGLDDIRSVRDEFPGALRRLPRIIDDYLIFIGYAFKIDPP